MWGTSLIINSAALMRSIVQFGILLGLRCQEDVIEHYGRYFVGEDTDICGEGFKYFKALMPSALTVIGAISFAVSSMVTVWFSYGRVPGAITLIPFCVLIVIGIILFVAMSRGHGVGHISTKAMN